MADLTREQWAAALLDRLGYQQTPGAMQALVGWARAEGGNWNNSAKYNPLNTTQGAPGSKTFRSVGQGAADIRIYNSWDQGLDATVQTLRNGRYGGILAGLKAGNPHAVASAIDASKWGTHGSYLYGAIEGAPARTVQTPNIGGGTNSGASTPSPTGTSTPSAPGAVGFQAPGAPTDYTGLLGTLLGQRNAPQPQQDTPLQAPQFSASVALPKSFTPLTPDQPQAQQAATGAGSLLDVLRASAPTDAPSSGSSASGGLPGIAESVIAQRQANGPIASSPRPSSGTDGIVPLGGSKNAGKGAFNISGPDPKRLQPGLIKFADQVASVYGGPLTGLDGSTHSKFTVNGKVSEHYTGNATDVFGIGGLKYGEAGWRQQLVRAGQAALIAAGMPREEALKQTGGLYNVGNHQIIFNVNGKQYGGNHLDHLHISTHAG